MKNFKLQFLFCFILLFGLALYALPARAYDASIVEFWNFEQSTDRQKGLNLTAWNAGAGYTTSKTGLGTAVNNSYNYTTNTALNKNWLTPQGGVSTCYWWKGNNGGSGRDRTFLRNGAQTFTFFDMTLGDNFSFTAPTGSGGFTGGFNNITNIDSGGAWHYICVVMTYSSGSVYVDGVELFYAPYVNYTNFASYDVGWFYNKSDNWPTYLDEILVLNQNLSQQDVDNLYALPNGLQTGTPIFPPPPPTFQINLLTPSPTPNATNYSTMPAQYNFTYENPLNWYPQIRFMVKRQEDSLAHGWPDYVNSATYLTLGVASSTLTTASTTFQLPDGTYDLRVDFWANIPAMTGMATTSFIVHTGGTYGGYSFSTSTQDKLFNMPSISEADLCGNIATTTTFGAIECGFKKALVGTITWAFAPSFDTLQNFKISYDLWKGCFPFNTFFQLTDTITSVASSTATSTAGTIKIPFIHTITGGGTFYMMDAISSSTLSHWIGATNYALFRTTIGYFFWLIAGAIVFFTIKFI